MSVNDENFEDFKACLEKLINLKLIENEAALGISKFVIANGTDALSARQTYTFKKHILDEFFDRKCSKCGEGIPWSEMFAIYA